MWWLEVRGRAELSKVEGILVPLKAWRRRSQESTDFCNLTAVSGFDLWCEALISLMKSREERSWLLIQSGFESCLPKGFTEKECSLKDPEIWHDAANKSFSVAAAVSEFEKWWGCRSGTSLFRRYQGSEGTGCWRFTESVHHHTWVLIATRSQLHVLLIRWWESVSNRS